MAFFISSDIIDEKTGKIYFEAGYEIDEIFLQFLNDKKLIKLIFLNQIILKLVHILEILFRLDKARSREEALFEIFKILRPGEPPNN